MNFWKKMVLILVLLIGSSLLVSGLLLSPKAVELGPYQFSLPDAYDETNTFDYIEVDPDVPSSLYDLTSGPDNDESMALGLPLVTVLTHGLGGDASHWSNGNTGAFAYEEDSLVSRLRNYADANVYYVRFIGSSLATADADDFLIVDIGAQMTSMEASGVAEGTEASKFNTDLTENDYVIDRIEDTTKHIIIVFDAKNGTSSNGSNMELYKEFNAVMSRVVYDLRYALGGVLPRLNLIGHSRGGLTNLMYAMDHPEMVNQLFSLGTPYYGSTSAEIYADFLTVIEGEDFSVANPGVLDIVNPTIYQGYMGRWNAQRDASSSTNLLYDDIEVFAMGGYCTMSSLGVSLLSQQSRDTVNPDAWLYLGEVLVAAITAGRLYLELNQEFPSEVVQIAIDLIAELDLPLSIDELLQFLLVEINLDYVFPFVSMYNDGFVDLDSQLGDSGTGLFGYEGFTDITKRFTEINTDYNDTAVYAVPIVHNLEAKDTQLLSHILNNIDVSPAQASPFETYPVSETEVGIRALIGDWTASMLVIPGTIAGKTVVEIGDCAFSDQFFGRNQITAVSIPASVRGIGPAAFENCQNLQSVLFVGSSQLEVILEDAFSSCTSLTTIQLPDNLKSLSDGVFMNCSSLQSLNLGAELEAIGERVFLGSGIVGFTDNCPNFLFSAGALYSQNLARLIYCPSATSIVVPSATTTIAPYAFSGNTGLSSINLSNVKRVEKNAFDGCTSLSTITGGSQVEFANRKTFEETPWFANQGSLVLLGKVLLKYEGTANTFTVGTNIYMIGEYAFSSTSLTRVYVPDYVEIIGEGAFVNCPNLNEVYLVDPLAMVVLFGHLFDDDADVTIYVADGAIFTSYQTEYEEYADQFSLKPVVISFIVNSQFAGTRTFNYFSILTALPEATKTGYDFVGWKLETTGEIFFAGSRLTSYAGAITLVAQFEVNEYTITLNPVNTQANLSMTVEYGQLPQYPTVTKLGYTFLGWYDHPTGGVRYSNAQGVALRAWDQIVNDFVLYAHWTPTPYTITLLHSDTQEVIQTLNYTIEQTVTLPVPEKYGYKFNGWVDPQGNPVSVVNPGSHGNKVFLATWMGDLYTVTTFQTALTVTAAYSIVDMTQHTTFILWFAPLKLTVASTVKELTIIGDSTAVHLCYIVAESRSSALVIRMRDFSMKASSGTKGVQVTGNVMLTMYFDGTTNRITGGQGTTDSVTGIGNSGAYAIQAYRLTVYGTAIIRGGKGGTGKTGTAGAAGADGVNGPSGSVFNPIDGDPGQDGGNGGNGGNGGYGGYALYLSYTGTAYTPGSGSAVTLIGGAGGDGGAGGAGGAGGDAADDTNGSILNGVGDVGDGGDGGDGGNGGNGGTGQYAYNRNSSTGTRGVGGYAGAYGLGGTGGEGGDAGSSGTDGADGSSGSNGMTGSNGTPTP